MLNDHGIQFSSSVEGQGAGEQLDPLLGANASDEEAESDGLSTLGTATMVVNTIIGAGILGLPYAFYHSGGWLALGTLALATLLSGINVGYLIEVTGWCEGFQSAEEGRVVGGARFKIRQRKFEMSEMCGLLLAPRACISSQLRCCADESGRVQLYRRFLEFAFFSYVVGSCWLYSTVFASTLSMLVPLPGQADVNIHRCWDKCSAVTAKDKDCGEGCVWSAESVCAKEELLEQQCAASYNVFLLVYLTFQLGMCFVDLNTFKNIQVLLSGSAFTAILVMVSTSLAAIVADGPDSGAYDQVPPLNPNGVVSIITTGLFAQMCHQGVATIVHMSKKKQQAKRVFSYALCYTLVIYSALGFFCSFHLGPRTNPIITLNWIDYNGGAPIGSPGPIWAQIARWLVLLFPIFSTSAAFSLQIIPLSETVVCVLPASLWPLVSSSSKALALRVLLTFLPILAAAWERDVVRILEFNGIFGFVIGFFTPCFLQLAALYRSRDRFGADGMKTPYWDLFSGFGSAYSVLAVCTVLFGVTVYQTIQDYSQ